MNLQLGEVVLIRMPFHSGAGAKMRPAVVLLDVGDDDLVVAPITSQPRHSEFDLPISEWAAAQLNVRSSIRVHKLTVLAKAKIVQRIGSLSTKDLDVLVRLTCRAFCRRASPS